MTTPISLLDPRWNGQRVVLFEPVCAPNSRILGQTRAVPRTVPIEVVTVELGRVRKLRQVGRTALIGGSGRPGSGANRPLRDHADGLSVGSQRVCAHALVAGQASSPALGARPSRPSPAPAGAASSGQPSGPALQPNKSRAAELGHTSPRSEASSA